ncbi:MAG TPA: AbrB/MazE/SpoVT family DNA-binding domain-containing protein [bacterium]|nr:AbrB/MazE/SpoVT family DNA-binding domain-containing protein [bacterium]
MEITLTQIGNSQGFRIPANILKQMSARRFDFEFDPKRRVITIKPIVNPREGWADACARLHANGDDMPIIPESLDLDFGMEAYPCKKLKSLTKGSASI